MEEDTSSRKELDGYYSIICNGEETARVPYYILTPWRTSTGVLTVPTTTVPGFDTPSTSTHNPPNRTVRNEEGGYYILLPHVYSETTTCTPYEATTATATPNGDLASHALVMTDSAGGTKNICAHVKMEFKQTAVMSREGFEGTLTLSNQAATELTNITFTATVLDSEGVDVSDLFEIVDNPVGVKAIVPA